MAFDDFKKKLLDQSSKEHDVLLGFAKQRIKKSRDRMAQNYDRWDYNDAIFRSRRKTDKEDRASVAKGGTAKMIVPLTFSQILTMVAFSCATLQQNTRFFNLGATGRKDNPLKEPMETILQRDVQRNQWNTFLVQFFLDVGKFSLGCAEICYEEVYRHMRVPMTEEVPGPAGTTVPKTTANFIPIPVFIGNRVHSLSPYRFYPDADLPITRYQEGHYCGSEDMFDLTSLQSDDALINVDKIVRMPKDHLTERKAVSRLDDTISVRANPSMGGAFWNDKNATADKENYVKEGGVVVTKLVIDIVPKNFGEKEMTSLGEEDFPVRYIVWYANDQTIIRFEEAYYLHGMFPYICGQFLPDQHSCVTDGLADVCDQITEYITWLANTHKASQANSVESRWAIDPSGVEMSSIESRSPYIKLKKVAFGTDVRRYVQQFTTQDVTAGAPQEITMWKDLLDSVSGYSGFMQGQSSAGRRSATQDKVVTQGAAARGKTTLGSIWDQAFQPLGRQFISNNRQEMDMETFAAIIDDALPINPNVPSMMSVDPATGQPMLIPVRYTLEELYALFKSDPISIARSEDFFVFDGSLPSEKAFLAQSLQEIFLEMVSNPQIAAVMGYGPTQLQEVFETIAVLRGVPQSMLPAPTPQPPMAPPGAPASNITALPPPEANESAS